MHKISFPVYGTTMEQNILFFDFQECVEQIYLFIVFFLCIIVKKFDLNRCKKDLEVFCISDRLFGI